MILQVVLQENRIMK